MEKVLFGIGFMAMEILIAVGAALLKLRKDKKK